MCSVWIQIALGHPDKDPSHTIPIWAPNDLHIASEGHTWIDLRPHRTGTCETKNHRDSGEVVTLVTASWEREGELLRIPSGAFRNNMHFSDVSNIMKMEKKADLKMFFIQSWS